MEKIKTLYTKTKSDLEDSKKALTKLEAKIAILTKEIAQFEKAVPTLNPKIVPEPKKKKKPKKEVIVDDS